MQGPQKNPVVKFRESFAPFVRRKAGPRNSTTGKETAFSHMLTKVPTAYPSQTVGEVLAAVRRGRWQSADHIFVLSNEEKKKLTGVVSVGVLFAAAGGKKILEVAREDFPVVYPDIPEEKVATTALRHDFDMVPVVERKTGKFLGAIDGKDLLRILHESHTERLLRRAGILKDEHVINIFRAKILTLVRLRLPWLLIGLGGGMAATILASHFENVLRESIALAFFIPAITYMNDAAGTQTVTLLVRGLALGDISLRHVARALVKELSVGVLLGAVLGALIFVFALLAFGSLPVAQTVGISMFIGVSFSAAIAFFFTYGFHLAGKDPAVGADPLVTVVQDIISILIYLFIASVLVF